MILRIPRVRATDPVGITAAVIIAAVIMALITACATHAVAPTPQPNTADEILSATRGTGSSVPPADRSVAISTTGCGHASKTVGSGVVVGDGIVLTAAHVVIGASTVLVDSSFDPLPASVIRLDRTSDLAILAVPGTGTGLSQLATASAQPGDPVRFFGTSSGEVPTTIGRSLDLRVDDVRSTSRSVRHGYDLDVRLQAGDSGGGVFDDDNNLVAIVFSAPIGSDTGRPRTYAVNHTEIDQILRAPDTAFVCDATQSQLTAH